MDHHRTRPTFSIQIKSSTWQKDSHSLYDYESTKTQGNNFTFPINPKAISIYRKRQSSTVIALDETMQQNSKIDLDEYQLLTRFDVRLNTNSNKFRLDFDNHKSPRLKKMSSQRLNTDQSNSAIQNKQEDTYMVVRKLKETNKEQEGYRLTPGTTIKLGRIQYFVSQTKQSGVVNKATKNGVNNFNTKIFKVNQQNNQTSNQPKNACKICLDQIQTPENFLFNPCFCTGSCGTVHIDCLTQWIHIKVKKEAIGGTIHFNFNKFQCEVCKCELPMIIQNNNTQKLLLPIQKPQGNYLILEGACEKTKSVMLIQNVPLEGIKLGRGHECEIRITDISVSRNHACIKNIGNSFYLFDNKSKFGTLVKSEPLTVQLGKNSRTLQVGRTLLNFSIIASLDQTKQIKELRSQQFTRNKPIQ